jgi:hypothetical protein
MDCFNLVIDKAGTVAGASVLLGLDHTYIGDLTIKLYSPANKILTLMSVPGYEEEFDDGFDGSLESSNLSKASPVLFRDPGAKDAELMGDSLPTNGVICKDDGACDYFPNPGAGPGLKFSDFTGIVAKGTWKFCAGDRALNDFGTLDAVTLTLTLMP